MTNFLGWLRPKILFFIHFLSAAIFTFLVLVPQFVISANTDGMSQKGVSVGRLLFVATSTCFILFLLIMAFYFLVRADQAEKLAAVVYKNRKNRNKVLRIGVLGFVLFWTAYFFPPYLFFQNISGYFLQVKALLLSGIINFGLLIMFIYIGSVEKMDFSIPFENRRFFKIVFIVLLLFFLVFLFIFNTGLGLSIREDYWYGAGAPVLWIQVAIALIIGIICSWAMNNVAFLRRMAKIDTIIFLLLWVIGAYFWGKEPLRPSYFMPDTGVNAIYPYSDSATFDLGSQYALIGQGLFNGQYFDRSLYPSFLAYLHILAGQNTENLMLFQAVVFAAFPAILYLLGKELHGRLLGISIALLTMFRGINSIFGASLIDLAGPKMMLTDFPTAIGIALIILFFLKWIKNPQKIANSILVGCSIGLTLLLRTHAIFLLPFILLFTMILFKDKKIFWIYGSVFLLLGMIISTLPLDFQNQKKGVPIFYMYYSRIQEVLKARYGILNNSDSNIPEKLNSSLLSNRDRSLVYFSDELPVCESKYCAVGNHFLHNFATSVIYLPASFGFDDFKHTVKEVAPYWRQDWIGGGLRADNYLLLFLNLAVISLGVGVIWDRRKVAALFPLFIFIVYLLSNSLALTSGGRYITPVDWIVCVYYMMGLVQLCSWLSYKIGFDFRLIDVGDKWETNNIVSEAISFQNVVGMFAVVLLAGSLIPLTDHLFPRRYHEKSVGEALVTLTEQQLLEKANLTEVSVAQFLNTPNAELTLGRLLYPRFYSSGYGEPGLDYPYTALDYRRLVFMVAGPFNSGGVILPIENSQPNLQASDVIVLGCTNGKFVDAIAVFIISEPKKVLLRSTTLTLQCPQPSP